MGSYGLGTIDLSNVIVNADLNMGAHNLKSDTIPESSAGKGVTADGVLLKDKQIHQRDVLMAQNKDKVASNNLRHSIDAVEICASAIYEQATNKILTFTHGIKGIIRVKATIDPPDSMTGCYKLLKDGAGSPLAVENCIVTVPLTDTDDLTVDWAPGTTLNLFVKCSSGNMNVSDFRVYYDDGTGFSAVQVAVTGAD